MAGNQLLKRVPRIKFLQRRPKAGDSSPQSHSSVADEALKSFISRASSGPSTLSASGKASLQPKRTPLSNDEIEAVMLGGCI